MNSYSPNSILSIREAIAHSDGNEVFFLGHTDPNLQIWSVTVLARGNRHSVPALTSRCHRGDTVIHNHPSGDLTPSAADLKIANLLGEQGIGFHIVDNVVENVYKVVEACPALAKNSIKAQEVAALLSPTGSLATYLGNYEERPEQLRMAFAVTEAFNNDGLATIEAGTGTGKSLAYLIPAILWSLRNEEPIVISTNTINLQEQLIRHDLPMLRQVMPDEFQAVLVKGRSNYLCRRRLEIAYREPDLFSRENLSEIEEIRAWATSTKGGSKDELNVTIPANVWGEVCCEMDQCPRTRCPYYSRCFFHKARRRAAHADLLIVNHSLLLSDLAVRLQTENYSAAAVLPPYNRIIIDEAHHLEEAATRNFSIRISHFSFARILNRLSHPRKQERGHLPRLLSAIAKELPDSASVLYDSLYSQIETIIAACRQLRDQAHQQFTGQCDKLTATADNGQDRQNGSDNFCWHITATEGKSPRWVQLHTVMLPLVQESIDLAKKIAQLSKQCGKLLPEKLADSLKTQLNDILGLSDRLAGLGCDLNSFLSLDEQACSWAETSVTSSIKQRRRQNILWLNNAPISIASTLKQALYDRFRSVIMTSATLATNHSFNFFNQRSGLELCSPQRRAELQLESPFDFAHQALIAIPTDIPEPNHAAYAEMLLKQIEVAAKAAQGRTFVLFTAYTLLRKIYTQLDAPLNAQGFHCMHQGQTSRHLLLEQFKQGGGNILLGTDSFWEGVDVPGRALELVIITRLPFRVPTEPLQIARCAAIEQQGGNAFTKYTVPQAIIRLKQGFGRLIRHRNDRGVVLILDQRVVSKNYGKVFLNSLPPARRITAPAQQIHQEIHNFLNKEIPTQPQ
jgi:ATP-dependent DNA helicase DinG